MQVFNKRNLLSRFYEKARKVFKKSLKDFFMKGWKSMKTVRKETAQHSQRSRGSFSHLNNMSFLCFQSLSNHHFRKLCKEMWTEQPHNVSMLRRYSLDKQNSFISVALDSHCHFSPHETARDSIISVLSSLLLVSLMECEPLLVLLKSAATTTCGRGLNGGRDFSKKEKNRLGAVTARPDVTGIQVTNFMTWMITEW